MFKREIMRFFALTVLGFWMKVFSMESLCTLILLHPETVSKESKGGTKKSIKVEKIDRGRTIKNPVRFFFLNI